MPKSTIHEDYKPLKLNFINVPNLVIIPTINDGNCYFHSVLRAFNSSYMTAKTPFDRINIARTFRNGLADRLNEIDPLTSKDYYSGLSNGKLENSSHGIREYTKEALHRELFSSSPVDNIYQELISNAVNKDIYIIDGETMDIYNTCNQFSLLYKGRNSIVIFYTSGHFEVVGIKRTDGSIDTLFTPEHILIQTCRDQLLKEFRKIDIASPRTTSPRVTSPKRIR